MTASLSIKKVPVQLVTRLRRRAARNHRSLQGELLSILEEAVGPKQTSIKAVCQELAKLDLQTADQSVVMLREDRDGR